jgi:hypothetical protein
MASGLNPKILKELIYEISGCKPSEEMVRVFRTISKVYCGQLIEEARAVQIEELALKAGGEWNLPSALPLGAIKP